VEENSELANVRNRGFPKSPTHGGRATSPSTAPFDLIFAKLVQW
jgi:hypothetical protein